jgi:hypothetical protein
MVEAESVLEGAFVQRMQERAKTHATIGAKKNDQKWLRPKSESQFTKIPSQSMMVAGHRTAYMRKSQGRFALF